MTMQHEKLRRHEEGRTEGLTKLKRQKEFAARWEEKGQEEHRLNQLRRTAQEDKDHEFKRRSVEKTLLEREKREALQQAKVQHDISDFEEKNGLTAEEESAEDPQPRGFKTGMTEPSGLTLRLKVKEKDEFKMADRGKRRRKMIVDQGKSQQLIELDIREQAIVDKFEQESKQEKEIVYETWRAMQQKNVIVANRQIREQRYVDQTARSKLEEAEKQALLL